jgi:hypothetical protein
MKRPAATLAVLVLLAACKQQPAADVDALHAACVNAMVGNTCRVMQASGQSLVPEGTDVIFVAGIGPISAELYRKLRDSGDGMCSHVRDICARDWNGEQCRTARTLYGVDSRKS